MPVSHFYLCPFIICFFCRFLFGCILSFCCALPRGMFNLRSGLALSFLFVPFVFVRLLSVCVLLVACLLACLACCLPCLCLPCLLACFPACPSTSLPAVPTASSRRSASFLAFAPLFAYNAGSRPPPSGSSPEEISKHAVRLGWSRPYVSFFGRTFGSEQTKGFLSGESLRES